MVLVAPSGAGKSTMARRLLDDFDRLRFSISATTRQPREYETDGKEYHFLSQEEFQQKIDNGEFLEWEEVFNGNRYGTLRSAIDSLMEKEYFVLLDIEVLGALNVKEMYGDQAFCIYIMPPDLEELKRRLKRRGTESEEMLHSRLERARKELDYADRFDKVVINDDLETAYREIHTLVSEYIGAC